MSANSMENQKSTLSDRKTGRYSVENPPNMGRKPIFSKEELDQIVNQLLQMASIGYGCTPTQALNLMRYIAEKFKDSSKLALGQSFLKMIYLKFPELSSRKGTAYDYQKSKSLTPEIVQKFLTF